MAELPSKTLIQAKWSRFAQINRLWRLVGTAISFTLFGLGGLVVGLVIAPLLWLLVRDPQRRERLARKTVSYGCRAFINVMRLLGVLRYHIIGVDENLVNGGCLIVANHPSLIDVVFLLAMYPEADCVVKAALWANPCMMLAVRAANFIPNRDPVTVLQTCVQRLKAGRKLILFPEGTRTIAGESPDFKRGAASIALRAGVPCLPVYIRCTPTTLTKADRWYDVPAQQVLFQAHVLTPVATQPYIDGGIRERDASVKLNADLEWLLSQDRNGVGERGLIPANTVVVRP